MGGSAWYSVQKTYLASAGSTLALNFAGSTLYTGSKGKTDLVGIVSDTITTKVDPQGLYVILAAPGSAESGFCTNCKSSHLS